MEDRLRDFGVRVHPIGRKVYIVKYRREGRAVKATIGPHGELRMPDSKTGARIVHLGDPAIEFRRGAGFLRGFTARRGTA